MGAKRIVPDRSSPDEAEAIIADLIPDFGVRTSCLELLASEIDEANRFAPAGWGVTLGATRVRLNVGPIEVLIVVANRVHTIADNESLSPGDKAKFAQLEATVDGPAFYRSVPQSIAINIAADSEYATQAIALLRQAALRPIEVALKTATGHWKQSSWAHSHSPGVIEYASKAVGRDLPSPSYVEL